MLMKVGKIKSLNESNCEIGPKFIRNLNHKQTVAENVSAFPKNGANPEGSEGSNLL